MDKITIITENDKSSVFTKTGESLISAIRLIQTNSCNFDNCPKENCSKCVIKIKSGTVSLPSSKELKIFSTKELELGYRLLCETYALGNVVFEINDSIIKEE